MRVKNGTWECKQCGQPLVVPPDKEVHVRVITSPDMKHGERALLVEGKEIHRCIVYNATVR